MYNGRTCEMRIAKRKDKKNKIETTWNDIQLENGDIVYIDRCVKKQKVKKVGDGWVNVPGEFYWYMGVYHKVSNI